MFTVAADDASTSTFSAEPDASMPAVDAADSLRSVLTFTVAFILPVEDAWSVHFSVSRFVTSAFAADVTVISVFFFAVMEFMSAVEADDTFRTNELSLLILSAYSFEADVTVTFSSFGAEM